MLTKYTFKSIDKYQSSNKIRERGCVSSYNIPGMYMEIDFAYNSSIILKIIKSYIYIRISVILSDV